MTEFNKYEEIKKESTLAISAATDTEHSSIDHMNIIQQNKENVNTYPQENFQKSIYELQHIPEPLKQEALFCLWKYATRNSNPTKIPFNPRNGTPAKSNDPSTFTGFEDAYKVLTRDPFYDGIGVGIFNGLCAIDLDDCFDPCGLPTVKAQAIIDLMDSYTEISPSGNGIHILFYAPGFTYNKDRYYIMNHESGIEIYVAGSTNKYLTITGNRIIPESGKGFYGDDRTEQLQLVLEQYMLRKESDSAPKQPAQTSSVLLSDDKLIEIACAAKNGAAFSALWNGVIPDGQSHSETDMALCSHLAFWTGRDSVRMDEMFRRSGLMRQKWDEKHGADTYGEMTIKKAVQNCNEVYSASDGFRVMTGASCGETDNGFRPIVPFNQCASELPPFPLHCLPMCVAKYVEAVARTTQTSPEMAGTIALGIMAICLQGQLETQVSNDYIEQLSLYVAIIAAPGERKSPVQKQMLRPVLEYEKQYNEEHQMDIIKNNRMRDDLEHKIASLQKKMISAPAEKEEQYRSDLNNARDELDQLPKLFQMRCVADDVSPQKLASIMAEQKGRIAIVSTEGGIFDIMNGRFSNKPNLDIFLKAWSGDPIFVDRIGREREAIMKPALSAIIMIQPSVLKEIMSNVDMGGRGLMGRFLFVTPFSQIGHRTLVTDSIPPEIIQGYDHLIRVMLSIRNNGNPIRMHLSQEALTMYEAAFTAHERYLVGEGADLAEWATKYMGTILRIAGILQAANVREQGLTITRQTMHNALELGEYFQAHARYAFSLMGTDITIRKASFVLDAIKRKHFSVGKRSDLYSLCRGRFFPKTQDIDPILAVLVEHGYIRLESPNEKRSSAGGRPEGLMIHVNPDFWET